MSLWNYGEVVKPLSEAQWKEVRSLVGALEEDIGVLVLSVCFLATMSSLLCHMLPQ